MKNTLLLLLFLFAVIAHSQNITVQNADDGQPVPYTTVTLLKKQKPISSFYTTEGGKSYIPHSDYDTAEFSSVGFETLALAKGNITPVIILKPEIIKLDEIAIDYVRVIDTVIGEYNEKKIDKFGIGRQNHMAVFFENNFGEAVPIKSLLLKLAKIKYTTALRVHLYSRKDYEQKYYLPDDPNKTWHSFDSFIPDKDLYNGEIVVTLPAKEKDVKIDLSPFDINLPQEGAFIGLEVVGYYDNDGVPLTDLSYKETTMIETHTARNDNYCRKITVEENNFWQNENRHTFIDMVVVLKTLPDFDVFQTPTMGLEVSCKATSSDRNP